MGEKIKWGRGDQTRPKFLVLVGLQYVTTSVITTYLNIFL